MTPSEDDKSNVSFRVFSLKRLRTFKVWWSSEVTSSDSKTLESDAQILVQNFNFSWNSNCFFICSSRTKTWYNTLDFSLLFCTLEHTFTYPIGPLILCYHQTSEALYKTHFVSTISISSSSRLPIRFHFTVFIKFSLRCQRLHLLHSLSRLRVIYVQVFCGHETESFTTICKL